MRGPLLAVLLLCARPASADETTDRLHHFQQHFETLQARDTRGAATAELGTLRAWITDARRAHDRGRATLARRLLDRVSAQARLIEALVGRAEAVDAARQARQLSESALQDAQRIRQEAWMLEQQLRRAEGARR